MNRSFRLTVIALALVAFTAPAVLVAEAIGDGQDAKALAAVAGKYEGNTDSPKGVLAFTCELKLEEGVLKGSMVAGPYSIVITSATLEGDRLQLNGAVDGMGLTIGGTWKAGVFEGAWNVEGTSGVMKMAKVPPSK